MRQEYSNDRIGATSDSKTEGWQCIEDASREKHYSIHEISKLWGLSEKTIRRIFQNERGVVELGTEESRSKRAYITRRIPESVMRRVHRQLRKTA